MTLAAPALAILDVVLEVRYAARLIDAGRRTGKGVHRCDIADGAGVDRQAVASGIADIDLADRIQCDVGGLKRVEFLIVAVGVALPVAPAA
jgi:hypothetical protein